MARSPRDTSTTDAFGLAIARNEQRLNDALNYWRTKYQNLGETILEDGQFSTPALKFAQTLKDNTLESLTPEFAGLFSPADEQAMLSRAGCLMSTEEILKHVLGSSTGDVVSELNFLAEGNADDTPRMARALRLARELCDLIQRFLLCEANARSSNVPFSELLAIYRQEGALGLAPSKPSWAHAPFIATSPRGCRSDSLSLWDSEAERTGFLLSHPRNATRTPSESNDVSLSFGLLIRHIVVICGLDSILLPRLVQADELLAWFSTVRNAPAKNIPQIDTLKRNVLRFLSRRTNVDGSIFERQRSLASQTNLFDAICLGLAMARIERAGTDTLPDEKTLLDAMQTDLTDLVAAHAGTLQAGNVFLTPQEDQAEARLCLSIQAFWYMGRRQLATLLALRDRATYRGVTSLAPQLAYLRYNAGEFNFVRLLCRFAEKFDWLRTEPARRSLSLTEAFNDAAAAIPWNRTDHSRAQGWLQIWADNLARSSPLSRSAGWRHLGLLNAMAARGPISRTTTTTPRWMITAADAVRDLLTFYNEKGLLDVLTVLIQTHPISTTTGTLNLIGLEPVRSLHPMRGCFSFERQRRAYAKALLDAGIAEIPP